MYPVIVRFGDFEITSFGVMVGIAVLVGVWVYGRELQRARMAPDRLDAALWGAFGGMAGAKLIWAIEFSDDAPFLELLLSRGGLSWYGGLLGGVGAAVLVVWRRHWKLLPILAAATPALAFGHLLGRIGCFLVGDDYGRPTNLPWGIAFPQGLPPTTVPVHPTQLYEAAFLGALGWLLIHWRRTGLVDAAVLGRYLILAGAARFAIEFIRVNEPVALGLTLAQWLSLTVIIAGAGAIATGRRSKAAL
ncbi:MAG TPA: prolipoprotein diacylglyceryl transferase family protein [Vicinamibacterales bacterium]|nr:prolipoprotein diacylglyceryl transferase family protein [Vicinamibacterales bacterium]